MANQTKKSNYGFQMASEEILEEKVQRVRGRDSKFQIVAGPLILTEEPFKDTYVLEVRYIEEMMDHAKELPLQGFNSQLSFDYAEKSAELAQQFCEEHGFNINNHSLSIPHYQAVISRKESYKAGHEQLMGYDPKAELNRI